MDDFYSYKASKKLNKDSFKFNKITERKLILLNINGFKNINSVELIKYIKDIVGKIWKVCILKQVIF